MKKEEGRIEDKEVIFIKPYQYMKFIKSPTQTKIFRPLPYY